VQSFQARIAEQEHFNVDVRGLKSDPDVEFALQAVRRVLPVEPDDNRFLFLAHAIHQAYWTRLLGGTITVDDKRAEIIPAVMKLANIFERCDSKKTKQLVVYELTRIAALLMRKQELADFVQLSPVEFQLECWRGGNPTKNKRRVERTHAAGESGSGTL
jgi:hypothetical protein